MNLNSPQYRVQYSQHGHNPAPSRPDYPTPPPSFSHYPEYVHQPDSYPSYGETYNYEGSTHMSSPHDFSGFNYCQFTPNNSNPYATPPDESVSPSVGRQEDEEQQEEPTVISVSTAFHPNAHPHLPPADIILSSSEGVVFYVHSRTILTTCGNAFRSVLGSGLDDPKFRETIVSLDAPSEELNIVLHMLYGSSSAGNSPSFETLANAVDHMPRYSILPNKFIFPSTPLYNLLLSHAPLYPLDLYALAAHHGLHSLAVVTSSHLLSYSLPSITDFQAERIGAIYLKKLLLLHADRFTALKNILLQAPRPHPPTRVCGFGEQKRLTRAWALVSAYLAWDARPDISTQSMQAALNPLMEHLDCKDCHQALRNRIKEVVVHWSSVDPADGRFVYVGDFHHGGAAHQSGIVQHQSPRYYVPKTWIGCPWATSHIRFERGVNWDRHHSTVQPGEVKKLPISFG